MTLYEVFSINEPFNNDYDHIQIVGAGVLQDNGVIRCHLHLNSHAGLLHIRPLPRPTVTQNGYVLHKKH